MKEKLYQIGKNVGKHLAPYLLASAFLYNFFEGMHYVGSKKQDLEDYISKCECEYKLKEKDCISKYNILNQQEQSDLPKFFFIELGAWLSFFAGLSTLGVGMINTMYLYSRYEYRKKNQNYLDD